MQQTEGKIKVTIELNYTLFENQDRNASKQFDFMLDRIDEHIKTGTIGNHSSAGYIWKLDKNYTIERETV